MPSVMESRLLQLQAFLSRFYEMVHRAWKGAKRFQRIAGAPFTVLQNTQRGTLEPGTASIRQLVKVAEVKINKSDSAPFPYKHFLLRGWRIRTEHYESSSEEAAALLTQRFWRLYGQNITSLTLSRCKIPYNVTLLPLALWRAVPNLETLTLTNCAMKVKTQLDLEGRKGLEWRIPLLYEYVIEKGLAINLLMKRLRGSKRERVRAMLTKRIDALTEHLSECISYYHLLCDKQKGMDEMEKLLSDSNIHVKLKVLHLHNLTCRNAPVSIEWFGILNMLPNLERVLVQQQEFGVANLFGLPALTADETNWWRSIQKPVKLRRSRTLYWRRLDSDNCLTWNLWNWLTQLSFVNGILMVHFSEGILAMKSFICKSYSCPCRGEGETYVRKLAGNNVGLMRNALQQILIGSPSPNCLQVLFEKAVGDGGGNVDIFTRAITPKLKL